VAEGWIQAADRLPGRRLLYFRDRDELPRQLLDRLEASRAVHVLQRRELENDLLDPDAIARAMSNPPDELATLLTQFLQD
jgi:hypothetical protein